MKLAAIDLDGTLLNSQHQLVQENTLALRAAQQAGVKIAIATGRSVTSTLEMLTAMGLDGYLLALNGTFIAAKRGNEVRALRSSFLAKEIIAKAFAVAQEEQVTFIASNRGGSDRVVVADQNEVVQEFLVKRKDLNCLTPDEMLARLTDETVHYMKLAFTNQDRQKLLQLRKRLEQAGIPTIFSDTNYIEHVPAGVNKGTALAFLCDQLGISLDETVAIGDQENDIELLQMSGIGIAMGNALAPIKKVADQVTTTNDQAGVAQALARFL